MARSRLSTTPVRGIWFLRSCMFIVMHSIITEGIGIPSEQPPSAIKLVGIPCRHRRDCGALPSLACMDGMCNYCTADSDCNNNLQATDRKCRKVASKTRTRDGNSTVSYTNLCFEKDLFDPFTSNDLITSALAFLCTALSSGGGIGGGGVLVPLYILVMHLSPKHAIPLSKATIFGVAVAQFAVNILKRHPNAKHRPLIDYNLSLIMEPTTLCGTIVGVLLNHVLPSWFILSLLIVLLGFTAYRTFLKGIEVYRKEAERDRRLQCIALSGKRGGGCEGRRWSIYQSVDVRSIAHHWLALTRKRRQERKQRLEDEKDFLTLPPLKDAKLFDLADYLEAKRFSIIVGESKTLPLSKIFPLMFAWVIVLVSALLRGGHGASIIQIKCGSDLYWLVTILTFPLLCIVTWRAARSLRLLNRIKVLSGYPFVEGDIHWTAMKATKYPLLCIIAGVAAGMLGVGGGIVKGPMMLEMGVIPQVQSATAAFMILFTSSSTTLQFALGGQFPGNLQYDYMLWYSGIGFSGGLLGQLVVGYLLKRYRKTSLIIVILGSIIGLSAVMMGYTGILGVISDIQNHKYLGLSSMCGAD